MWQCGQALSNRAAAQALVHLPKHLCTYPSTRAPAGVLRPLLGLPECLGQVVGDKWSGTSCQAKWLGQVVGQCGWAKWSWAKWLGNVVLGQVVWQCCLGPSGWAMWSGQVVGQCGQAKCLGNVVSAQVVG